ncbi:MAG: hypothetical protein JSR73_14740 [Proteobacteria bacterium]|nr:hypothetical protein [Pseudomonadota bacterium]
MTTLQTLKARTVALVAIAGLVLAACANQMEPAKKLIADVEAAVAAAGADAQQYIPEQVSSVNQKLADLKAAFDKQDYKTVLAGAPALVTEAKGLADAAAAKKKEVLEALGAQWTQLAADLPQAVSAVESKLTAIAKTKKLPSGVTKDGVAAAKAGLAQAKGAWDEAKAAFTAGNVQAALDKAKGVKSTLADAAAKLGIAAPAPAG